jgi:hypothetical protein
MIFSSRTRYPGLASSSFQHSDLPQTTLVPFGVAERRGKESLDQLLFQAEPAVIRRTASQDLS